MTHLSVFSVYFISMISIGWRGTRRTAFYMFTASPWLSKARPNTTEKQFRPIGFVQHPVTCRIQCLSSGITANASKPGFEASPLTCCDALKTAAVRRLALAIEKTGKVKQVPPLRPTPARPEYAQYDLSCLFLLNGSISNVCISRLPWSCNESKPMDMRAKIIVWMLWGIWHSTDQSNKYKHGPNGCIAFYLLQWLRLLYISCSTRRLIFPSTRDLLHYVTLCLHPCLPPILVPSSPAKVLLKNSLCVWWTCNTSNNIQRHTRKEERPPPDLLTFLRQLCEVKEFANRKAPTRNKNLMCGKLLWGPGFVWWAGRRGRGLTRAFSLEGNTGRTNQQQPQLSLSPNAISRSPSHAQRRNSH